MPHGTPFPLPLSAYPDLPGETLRAILVARVHVDPFNAIATAIFLLAVVHTFFAARFTFAAHALQARKDAAAVARGVTPTASVAAELLHFFGEIEVIFGLWAVPLTFAIWMSRGWNTLTDYLDGTVNYSEAVFVVVIMALASTRPVIELAESALRKVATLGGGTPAAWWLTILTIGPLLGSLITEPGAMTIAALLLRRQFYDLDPSSRLKYATLGLLFVNISIGGTLTNFAAPPMLMVARPWEWGTPFVLAHFGWRATLAVGLSALVYYLWFRRELQSLAPEAAPATAIASRPRVDCPSRGGSRRRMSRFSCGPSSTRTIRRSSLAASSFSSGSIAPRPNTRRSKTSRRRSWWGSSSRPWSSTEACRAGGLRRCSRVSRGYRCLPPRRSSRRSTTTR